MQPLGSGLCLLSPHLASVGTWRRAGGVNRDSACQDAAEAGAWPWVPSLAVPSCRGSSGSLPHHVPEHPPALSPQFVLKHEALAHLREVALFPNTLNPHEAESLELVTAMVDQVMELHAGARWIHIGCDEVGACVASHTGHTHSTVVSSLRLLHLVAASLKQKNGPWVGLGGVPG